MMLFQQTMLNSTIEPIAIRPSFTTTERISFKSGGGGAHGRTVNFSSSTKKESSSQHQEMNQQQQQQQQSGVKRSHSHSVPIPNNAFHCKKAYEEKLTADEQMADERDFIFYARLVSGISERRASSGTDRRCNNRYNEETDRCLTHIIQTRHHNIQEQQGQDQQHEQQQSVAGGGVLIEEQGGGYYLGKDNACCTYSLASSSNSSSSSSSSYSSSSTYQQDFDNQDQHEHNDNDGDSYEGDNECIFELEL